MPAWLSLGDRPQTDPVNARCGDGRLGKLTTAVVRRFQTAAGLQSTGVVDTNTFARLSEPMAEAFAPFSPPPGTSLGLGGLGIIEAVLPAHHGAVPVVMRTPAGDRFQVDILRRDPRGPGGVATTAQFDLFIANRGDGATPTDEAQAHAVRGLAAWIAERLGGREADAVAELDAGALLTFRERQKAHPEGVFSLWS